jgi:hypothetical protein
VHKFRKPTNRFASRSLLQSTMLTAVASAPRTGDAGELPRGSLGPTEIDPMALLFPQANAPDCFANIARVGDTDFRCVRSAPRHKPACFPSAP